MSRPKSMIPNVNPSISEHDKSGFRKTVAALAMSVFHHCCCTRKVVGAADCDGTRDAWILISRAVRRIDGYLNVVYGVHRRGQQSPRARHRRQSTVDRTEVLIRNGNRRRKVLRVARSPGIDAVQIGCRREVLSPVVGAGASCSLCEDRIGGRIVLTRRSP